MKLPATSGKKVLRALERAGFSVVRVKGSHHMLEHETTGRRVTVPVHSKADLPPGTLRAILKQADVSVAEFLELL